MKEEVERLLVRHNRLYKRRTELSPALESIIDEVAVELGVTKDAIVQIVMAQFKMVSDVIRLAEREENETPPFEEFKSIRLIYFGTFLPSKSKYTKMVKRNKLKDV